MVIIGPVCVCVRVGGYVNHDNSKLRASILTKLGLQVKLQLTKFWPSRTPGKGSAAGRNFLAPYYSQRAVVASPLSAFFIFQRK